MSLFYHYYHYIIIITITIVFASNVINIIVTIIVTM